MTKKWSSEISVDEIRVSYSKYLANDYKKVVHNFKEMERFLEVRNCFVCVVLNFPDLLD